MNINLSNQQQFSNATIAAHADLSNASNQLELAYRSARLDLQIAAGIVTAVESEVGFLHRGIEKLVETKPFNQSIIYMDRLDSAAMICNEHVYVLAVEKLLGIEPPIRAQYIRVLFDELTRIASHMLWLGYYAAELGISKMSSYCMQVRENILDCYEAVSGSRVHANYYRPGGLTRDLPNKMSQYQAANQSFFRILKKLNRRRTGSLLDFIESFSQEFFTILDECESLLTDNPVWQQHNIGIGVVTADQAMAWGFSGPMLRATGVAWDLRKKQPYSVYQRLDFKIPVGKNGDNYDRYLVRMAEMREANRIIQQAVHWLKNNLGPIMVTNHKIVPPKKSCLLTSVEALIHHCKLFTEGYLVPKGECYIAIEHPRGELGIYLVTDGANKPYRLKIRTPSFSHMAAVNSLVKGNQLSDVMAILASADLSLAEVDR